MLVFPSVPTHICAWANHVSTILLCLFANLPRHGEQNYLRLDLIEPITRTTSVRLSLSCRQRSGHDYGGPSCSLQTPTPGHFRSPYEVVGKGTEYFGDSQTVAFL